MTDHPTAGRGDEQSEGHPGSTEAPQHTQAGDASAGSAFGGVGVAIAIGAAIGVIFGTMLDNLALGIGCGAGLGAVAGAIMDGRKRA